MSATRLQKTNRIARAVRCISIKARIVWHSSALRRAHAGLERAKSALALAEAKVDLATFHLQAAIRDGRRA